MKLTIFGASGRTGRLVTEQALEVGHDVVAFMRNPSKLTLRHERLRVVQGDLTDQAAVDEAVRDADAVLATLSPQISGGPRDLPLARGTRVILNAMQAHGIRRLVYTWGPSILIPRKPALRAVRNASFAVLRLFPGMRSMINETVEVGEVLRASDRDWTVVVVTMPNDEPGSGKVKVQTRNGDAEKVRSRISRADLAQFVLAQVNDLQYTQQEIRVGS